MSTHPRLRPRTRTRQEPPEIVVIDELESCPYLDGRVARLPMRLPLRALTLEETDAHLAAGDRRYGRLLYQPECPDCRACEPLRVPADAFVPTRSQRRAQSRGDRELRTEVGRPMVSAERLRLYEKHRAMRGLAMAGDAEMDEERYSVFFVDRLVDAVEFRFFHGDALLGFAVCDRGAQSLSAVYCAFDPDYSRFSIGTYSILKQIELARSLGLTYVYLGLYVAENAHLRYKAGFLPHERRIDGEWRRFDRDG